MSSNHLKTTQTNTNSNRKNKNVLKARSMQENIEINDQYSIEILDNNDIKLDLAMQIISTDKAVRNDTIQDLKEFNSPSLSSQAIKGKKLTSVMLAIKKAFNLMGDGIVELHTGNESLKSKIGSYDEKWLEESKAKLLQQINNEKRAVLIMSRIQKQMNK